MIYEFQCNACNAIFEVRASLAEKEKGLKPQCAACKSGDTHQIVAAFAMGGSGNDLSSGSLGHSHSGSSCSSCSSGSCGSCGH
jgi:putative FmdB family regulatory protein